MEYFWVSLIVIAAGFLVWREIPVQLKTAGVLHAHLPDAARKR